MHMLNFLDTFSEGVIHIVWKNKIEDLPLIRNNLYLHIKFHVVDIVMLRSWYFCQHAFQNVICNCIET